MDEGDVGAFTDTLQMLIDWWSWSTDSGDREAAYRCYGECWERKSAADRERISAALDTMLRFLTESGENSINRVISDGSLDLHRWGRREGPESGP